MLRDTECGEPRLGDAGKTITLVGRVNRRRDHGNLIFIDLRDRYGLTQIAFDPERSKDAWKEADKLRNEFVVQIKDREIIIFQSLFCGFLALHCCRFVCDRVETL